MPRSPALLLACGIMILSSLALAAGATAAITPPTTDAMTAGEVTGSGSIQVALLGVSFIALAVLVTTLRPVRENRRR